MYNSSGTQAVALQQTLTKRTSGSQVTEQLDMQNKLLVELAQAITTLSDALSRVTRQVPNNISMDSKADELVPLATELRCNNDSIVASISRIRTLTETIEL